MRSADPWMQESVLAVEKKQTQGKNLWLYIVYGSEVLQKMQI